MAAARRDGAAVATESGTGTARAPRREGFRAELRTDGFGFLFAEWTLCNIGQLGVVSILSLYLLTSLRLPPALAGTLLLFATITFRLARFPFLPLLDRVDPRRALVFSLSLASAGYALVALLPLAPPALGLAVLLVGIGYGSNVLLVKALAGASDAGRLTRYSALNVAVNSGAAIGPLVQTWLFLHLGPSASFLTASICFAAAAILMTRYPSHAATRRSPGVGFLQALRRCLAIPNVRYVVLGWACVLFLSTQLFAVLPLMATRALHATDLLGLYFTVNAILVVVAQLPMARIATAFGISPTNMIRLGFLFYGVGFVLLWVWPVWQVAFVMVVTCSLAEVLTPPGLDSIMAGALPASMRVSGFSLVAASAASGEALGLSLGVGAAGLLALHGELNAWYGVLAAVAAGAVLLTALMAAGPRPGAWEPQERS